MSISDFIRDYTLNGCRTLLGAGPMSVNCVDAATNLARKYNAPIMLIASRRQVDSGDFGGGYVNNWTTQAFSDYVKSKDLNGKVILARDHGGPWQNNAEQEQNLTLPEAMASAKRSYEADIDADFEIIHIDPSITMGENASVDEILERVYELYEHCWSYARSKAKDIAFEVGTEEQQDSGLNDISELDYQLNRITNFCKNQSLPKPLYVVVQTGTKVMETKNIGIFDSPVRADHQVPVEIQVPRIIEKCKQYGVLMKQHNTDYLSDAALRAHPRLGIHAANVAPEFGVAETACLLRLFDEAGMKDESREFMQIALNSNKYSKWMLENTKATELDKTTICGHYIFSHSRVLELKEDLASRMNSQGQCLNTHLRTAVEASMERYLRQFRII
jgi:tagatose-1,6-bisphosphate aldolase non-catalytic subunit AgaZ/GatZ